MRDLLGERARCFGTRLYGSWFATVDADASPEVWRHIETGFDWAVYVPLMSNVHGAAQVALDDFGDTPLTP